MGVQNPDLALAQFPAGIGGSFKSQTATVRSPAQARFGSLVVGDFGQFLAAEIEQVYLGQVPLVSSILSANDEGQAFAIGSGSQVGNTKFLFGQALLLFRFQVEAPQVLPLPVSLTIGPFVDEDGIIPFFMLFLDFFGACLVGCEEKALGIRCPDEASR